MVHGQVVLNQFKHYPVKAVRDAAFVPALRERMAQRRHSKLYAAPKAKQRSRWVHTPPYKPCQWMWLHKNLPCCAWDVCDPAGELLLLTQPRLDGLGLLHGVMRHQHRCQPLCWLARTL